jgi:hypothetical protein
LFVSYFPVRRCDILLELFGGTTLKKVAECERQAAECRQLAAEMKNPQQRKQLEDMAEVWDRLARQRRQGIVESKHDQA